MSNPFLCLLNDDSNFCISSLKKIMLFAGFTTAKKTIIQNWFTPHICKYILDFVCLSLRSFVELKTILKSMLFPWNTLCSLTKFMGSLELFRICWQSVWVSPNYFAFTHKMYAIPLNTLRTFLHLLTKRPSSPEVHHVRSQNVCVPLNYFAYIFIFRSQNVCSPKLL